MCQGHIWMERLDDLIDEMFALDDRMLALLLTDAQRILDDDRVRGRTAREYRKMVAAQKAARGDA